MLNAVFRFFTELMCTSQDFQSLRRLAAFSMKRSNRNQNRDSGLGKLDLFRGICRFLQKLQSLCVASIVKSMGRQLNHNRRFQIGVIDRSGDLKSLNRMTTANECERYSA